MSKCWISYLCLLLFLMTGCSLPAVSELEKRALPAGGDFLVLAGGQEVFERHWLPTADAGAVVVILHGSGSHGGSLDHLARYVAGRGFEVYAFDYPGFGLSPGRRAVTPPFAELHDILLGYLETISQRHPRLPLFLVGESMGGTLAIYADIHGGLPARGVVLCGAAFDYPPSANAFMRGAARVIGFFNADLPLVPVDPWEFTRSPEAVERLMSDPYMVTTRIPVRHVTTLMGEIAPLHGVEHLYRVAASREKKMTVYPDVMHAILHEPEWPAVAADMVAWMDSLRIQKEPIQMVAPTERRNTR